MPRKTKDAPGRVTPKGGPVKPASAKRTAIGSAGQYTTGRYTAPISDEYRSSSWIVPVLIVGFFGLGVICILLNYLGLLGGSASNVYLFIGLGLIVCGFIAATRWR